MIQMEGGGGGRDDTMRATQLRTHGERRNSGKSGIMVSTTEVNTTDWVLKHGMRRTDGRTICAKGMGKWKDKARSREELERTSRSCDVTTPRTNLRSQSVTMANMLRLRKASSSARGVEGVMMVYGVAAVRLNFCMYFSTLSLWRTRQDPRR